MESGTVCRCIKSFNAMSTDELSLSVNDILQVYRVIDKIWTEGQINNQFGKFPSSSVVQTETPSLPCGSSLFVAIDNLEASEEGDLTLRKGQFVIGTRQIDECWWLGQSMGKEGSFPLNHVWLVNMDWMPVKEDVQQDVVLFAKVKTSLRAQLPEELSLIAGTIVKITQVVDSDYFKGQYHDDEGIFPRSFVEILDEDNQLLNEQTTGSENIASTVQWADSCSTLTHSEPDGPLAQPDTPQLESHDTSTDSITPYGKAVFSFEGKFEDELSFNKGDTIQLLSHVDSHWTRGQINDDEGIFPTSYVQIIVDCDFQEDVLFETTKTHTSHTSTESLHETAEQLPEQGSLPRHTFEEESTVPSIATTETPHFDSHSSDSKNTFDDVTNDANSQYCVPDSCSADEYLPEYPQLSSNPQSIDTLPVDEGFNDEVVPEHTSDSDTNDLPDEISTIASNEDEAPVNAEKPIKNMRRHIIKELIETEHEYIHDLEALLHVIHLSKSTKESLAVDVDIFLSNIDDVIAFSKKLMSKFHEVCFEDDENLKTSRVFLELSDELCEVYKLYCSHHCLVIQPTLQKYQMGGETLLYLEWVLKELRQHKIKLMDISAVLIKPVQRVLKYPLFIDRLLESTSALHIDYQSLQEAKDKIRLVAKDINNYTKRVALVQKYKSTDVHSLESMRQRMSVHSVAKKGSRLKTRISASVGLFSQCQTIDPYFDEEIVKFHAMVKAARGILCHGEKLLAFIRSRHLSELSTVESIAAALSPAPSQYTIEAVRDSQRDNYNRLFTTFQNVVNRRVMEPVKMLVSLCCGPERILLKRSDKLLDFKQSEHTLEKNRDPTRTRILEEESLNAKGTYEALHTQLCVDIPNLSIHGNRILTLAMKTLIGARMQLQGQLAKNVFQLSSMNGIAYNETTSLDDFIQLKLNTAMKSLKDVNFLPCGFLLDSPMGDATRSTDAKVERRGSVSTSQGDRKHSFQLQHKHSLYKVIRMPNCVEKIDLKCQLGDVVAVLKEKDPTGCSDRWFVDNGTDQGFVRSRCLEKYCMEPTSTAVTGRQQFNSDITPSPNSIASSVPAHTHQNPIDPKLVEPPRYADLFFTDSPENMSSHIDNLGTGATSDVQSPHIYEEINQNTAEPEAGRQIYQNIPDQESSQQFYYALHTFTGNGSNQLNMEEGQAVLLLSSENKDWWLVENRAGQTGYVPSTYLAKYAL